MEDSLQGFPADLLAYAIVCTPRSGSTYLAELLASAGLGQPREHLRGGQIKDLSELVASVGDAAGLLAGFMRANEHNGVFGTKVISHCLLSLLSRMELSNDLVRLVRSNFRIIYLVRRDKTGQALSDFLAHRSNVWHSRTAQGRKMLEEAHASVEYSFNDVLDRRQRLVRDELMLADQVRLTSHRVVFYEDLLLDAGAVVGPVIRFLGGDGSAVPTATVQRNDPGIAEPFRRRFLADYRGRYHVEPTNFAPAGLIASPDGLSVLA
jgi:LPS sulfotransferase NodH